MRPRLALLAAAWLALAAPARAERCPPVEGGAPSLGEVDSAARLAFLRDELQPARGHALRWKWTWGVGYAALTAVQLALLAPAGDDQRIDLYFGAGRTAVGLAAVLFVALPAIGDARALRDDAGPATCARLAEAERLLLRDALAEQRGRAWYNHVALIAFNVATGAALAFAFHHETIAAVNTIVGIAAGEIMTATLPDEAGDALARYRRGQLAAPAPRARLHLAPSLAGRVGLDLAVTF